MPTSSNQAISSATVVVVSRDLGVEAAHDAADADRDVVGVADQQIARGERAVLAVEGHQVLAVGRQADAEPTTAERVEVVGVVRLVQLEHHVVADVDDVADRAHPGGGEPALHPLGRLADLDAGDHRRRETGATVAVDELDRAWCVPRR